ncbi:DoxX family protein [Kitasatospora sp. RB6PN24]|uniref:DoxX family protein n=1 Tax=Kitasatospora humi TaxID=2893891 RepID=UPI001E3C13AB|nr:DoxX family protein [Kitasatospora humi]MCC9311331.1 DoxX family protein [Kitasatospora humi]
MSTAHTVVTVLGAVMAGFSGASIFARASFVVEPLTRYGVPRSWWPFLGAAKLAGAAGLLIGLAVPVIGALAATGLVLYFLGAALTCARARAYGHIPFPLVYLAPALAALLLA